MGSTGKLKLESHAEAIEQYLNIGLSKRKTAKRLGVGYNTLIRFLKRHVEGQGDEVADGDNSTRPKKDA